MPVIIKLLFFTTTIWSAIYSAGYSICQFRGHRILSAVTAAVLTVMMLTIMLVSVFRL